MFRQKSKIKFTVQLQALKMFQLYLCCVANISEIETFHLAQKLVKTESKQLQKCFGKLLKLIKFTRLLPPPRVTNKDYWVTLRGIINKDDSETCPTIWISKNRPNSLERAEASGAAQNWKGSSPTYELPAGHVVCSRSPALICPGLLIWDKCICVCCVSLGNLPNNNPWKIE